jgi:microcystin-dependent protein
MGDGHTLGEKAGASSVTLTQTQMPTHMHVLNATAANGTAGTAQNDVYARALSNAYASPADLVPMSPDTVTNAGGSQPHNNMMPYLVLSFCIALQGIFPSRN